VGNFATATATTNLVGGASLSATASNGIYNFGSGTTTTGADRAVGFLSSGTATQSGNLYAQLANNTGGTLSGLTISYDVEKYRNGLNAAGFRMQLFYSTDGASWTNAGANFLTNFSGTADNSGCSPAPCATSSVANQALSVSIPSASNFYLAWNYSVASGTTTTNAQALAIDNISILGIGGGGSTNPSATASATPNPVVAGNQTRLLVTVVPGTNPQSTGIAVSGNLTTIGGSATQSFFDDGTNGDLTAGDNVFSYLATVPANTSGGTKTLAISVIDAQSRPASTSISLTVQAPTNPSVSGAANPTTVAQGGSTLLTGTVTPGTIPTSTGLTVTGNLTSIGGSATQTFYDDGTHGDALAGNNVFSFQATVDVGTSIGNKNIPLSVSDTQSRSGSGSISLTVSQQAVAPGTIVISQLYGGGGNSGATYTNDFVEIFNRSNTSVNLTGWSVQYASAGGTSWTAVALGGTLDPGHYYLVQLSAGAGNGVPLPAPDAAGGINMSANNGKVALVSSTTALTGGCPLGNGQLMDFVGYGTANCFEGAAAAPALDNVTADFRTHLGCKDTDSNGGNFVAATPAPRNTSSPTNSCPTGDFPPEIFGTSPSANEAHIAQNANITINFDEPVTMAGSWYQISCASTGIHTATVSGGPTSFILNPDTDFSFNEQCTVTVFASQVTDQDANDPPDNMAADYVFSFNSEFLRDPAEHMVMGNPSSATTDVSNSTNFLMMKIQYALSYNDNRRTPNWTSWHLDSTWRGSAPRVDDFRADTSLPAGYYQVQGTDYQSSGFDRGHMCPSADRTSTPADNDATFFMTNMVPQAPGNNQGPWANLENSLRTFLPGSELYIVSGGSGIGGIGSSGAASVLASGVTVPNKTWKAALVLPVGDNDVSRVDVNTRIIAVIMPNNDGIRPDDWKKYLATVDQIEALTGYDLYSNVPVDVQAVIESRVDAASDTAPVTTGQTKTVAEDGSVGVTLAATDFNVNNTFTFTIVDQPLHGSVFCTAENCTYSPSAHYFGPDSFTFKANDSALDSNVSTVNITVTEINNDPSAVNDNKETPEDSQLNFGASDLTGNDSAGPGEGSQTLTVDSIISTGNTHGSVVLTAGQVSYMPASNFNGPASFDFHVCDDGTTNGSPDHKCTTGTVNVTVTEVNDSPTASNDSKTIAEDTQLSFSSSDLTGNDSAGPANENGQTLTVSSVTATATTHGTVSLNAGQITYTPASNYNGPANFDYEVCDNGSTNALTDPKCTTGTVNVTVDAVNDAPTLADVPSSATINELSAYSFTASASDVDVPSQTLTFSLIGAPAGAAINPSTGEFSWTPSEAQGGTGSPYSFKVRVSDSVANTDAVVSLTVSEVNQAPTLDAIGGKTVLLGNTLTFNATGHDADLPSQNLTYSLTGTVPAGATIGSTPGSFSWTPSAAQVGQVYTFGVRVTDNGSPNRYAEEQISVGVGYTWSNLLSPIDTVGVSSFKLGRTIPVKFRLAGPSAGITNAVARLLMFKVSNEVVGNEVDVQSTSAATTGNLFRYDGAGQYIFNLDTSGLTVGTYQLQVDMGDGVLRAVNISLR